MVVSTDLRSARQAQRSSMRRIGALLFLLLVPVSQPHAAELGDTARRLTRGFFAGADEVGALEGEPPAAPVFAQGQRVGFAFVSDQVLPIPAYSGKPISVLVGLDRSGRIVGVHLLHHEEPILAVGIPARRLDGFIAQYLGRAAGDRVQVGGHRAGYDTVDGISGATITVMVLNATIMRAARVVAESRGLFAGTAAAQAQGGVPADSHLAQAWRTQAPAIMVLGAALLVLLLILIAQDWLVRRPVLLRRVRLGFLVFTVLFIGGYALAQLSVINVLTFSQAVMREFRWDSFLIDPLVFLLWGFVAVTLLLWGAGSTADGCVRSAPCRRSSTRRRVV